MFDIGQLIGNSKQHTFTIRYMHGHSKYDVKSKLLLSIKLALLFLVSTIARHKEMRWNATTNYCRIYVELTRSFQSPGCKKFKLTST